MNKETREKQVENFYDRIAADYQETHGFQVSGAILKHFLLANLPPKKQLTILDAGGGAGHFSSILLKEGHTIVLSDISDGMLKEAQTKLGQYKSISFVKESVINMNHQKDQSFDAVLFMNAILDYCGDCPAALNEAYRVLNKKGYLIGNVNNKFAYCKNHELKDEQYDLFEKNMRTGDRHIIWADQKEGHMSHEFTLDELKNALEEAGFKVLKLIGPFNLLSKKEMENIKDKERFIQLQITFAQQEEYLNNSQDFFFVAQK